MIAGADWWHSSGAWFFWAAVFVVLLRLIVKWIRISRSNGYSSRDLARKALRLQYLSGEIDKREYERRLADLRSLQGKSD